MPDFIPEPILFYFQHGAHGWHTHEAFQSGPDALGVLRAIGRLSMKIERDPTIGAALWKQYRERLIDLPAVKHWWAYQYFEIFEPELDEYLEELF